jgi:hypothetical protein
MHESRAGAQRDQRVHLGAAVLERTPRHHEEDPRREEQQERRQNEGSGLPRHEWQEIEQRRHRQDERRHAQRQRLDEPLPVFAHLSANPLNRSDIRAAAFFDFEVRRYARARSRPIAFGTLGTL